MRQGGWLDAMKPTANLAAASIRPRRLRTWRTSGLAMALALAVPGAPALAQSPAASARATGYAAANLVRPISVRSIDDLDFGMVASSGVGTVSIGTGNGAVSYGGRAREACSGAEACPAAHPARFEVTGERHRGSRISVPQSLQAAVASRPGGALRVIDLTVRSASRPASGAAGTLDGLGNDSFMVGATLEITAPLVPGHYTVPVPVTVAYE